MKGCELIASVMAESLETLRARRDAQRGVDAVELRLDALPALDVDGALAGRSGRVVVTCRPTWEGGRFGGSEAVRVAALRRALALGAEFVDIEWRAADAAALCAEQGSRVVLSTHDFEGVPSDLGDRVRAMLAMRSAVVKVAVTPRSLADLVSAARTVRGLGATNVVFIGMGASGFASRALPAKFGSVWSYCGDAVAPGQVPAVRLLDEFRFGRVSPAATVYAVVGRPIMHSLSPAMHNAAFEARGTDAIYVPLEASDWADFESMAGWLGIAGCSVTAPFKQEAFRAAAEMDAEARDVGAVNTLRRTAGRWQGLNSDLAGLLAPLAGEPLRGARVSVLGAGGAARAACVALRRAGSHVTVHARREERARAVATELGVASGDYPPTQGSWDVLINATPIGTSPKVEESPIPAASLVMGRLVYDLVYNPERTRLLAEAEAAGCRTLGGLEMLIAQAAAQFQWWTGHPPAEGVMAAAARRRLAERRDEGRPSA